jgi:hypothetical protein
MGGPHLIIVSWLQESFKGEYFFMLTIKSIIDDIGNDIE